MRWGAVGRKCSPWAALRYNVRRRSGAEARGDGTRVTESQREPPESSECNKILANGEPEQPALEVPKHGAMIMIRPQAQAGQRTGIGNHRLVEWMTQRTEAKVTYKPLRKRKKDY